MRTRGRTSSCLALAFVLLTLSGCGGGGGSLPPVPPQEPPPPPVQPPPSTEAHSGVEVAWIAREPRLPPPATLKAPATEGWPRAGSAVQWVATILNRGTTTVSDVPYTWRIDNDAVLSGVVDLPPGRTEVLLPWTWTFTRHQIALAIAPSASRDTVRDDNQLTIVSDALSLALWIERGVYDWMLEDGRPGYERWLQRELEFWNATLARAVYPTAPTGALDRIRVDFVEVVPNGYRYPNDNALEADLTWFVPNDRGNSAYLQLRSPPSILADQSIVLHELLHQRGLIDLYAYDVLHNGGSDEDGRINIEENGRPVVGTFLMPPLSQGVAGMKVFASPVNGLMGSLYRHAANLTEHCVNGLNQWAGRRTTMRIDQFGNALNDMANVPQPDAYVWKLPRRTVLSFVDSTGAPITGPTVDVFVDHNGHPYRDTYAALPDLTLFPDASGRVTLPGNVLEGRPPASSQPKSQVIILGVRTSEGRGFAFLPVYYLNLVYFRTGPEQGTLEIPVTLHRR